MKLLEELSNTGNTWQSVISALIGSFITLVFGYFATRNNNNTKVELAEIEKGKQDIAELQKHLDELEARVRAKDEEITKLRATVADTKHSVDLLVQMVDLMKPIFSEAVSTNPAHKLVVDNFLMVLHEQKQKIK